MKKSINVIAVIFTLELTMSTSFATDKAKNVNEISPSFMQELSKYQSAEKKVNDYLKAFDTLDFDVYSNQKWERLHESHAQDILVHYPDGRTSEGIDAHIVELKKIFVFAPDTRINEHPVRFGSGEWTGVIGVIQGTFSKPMPIDDNKTIPPTGRTFKLTMATIGHWTKSGVMDEEYLFWDNTEFMRQIGLNP